MARRDTIRVASAQYPLDEIASLEAWQKKYARWVADGAATGAELLVFPEYAAIEQAAAFGPAVSGDLAATLRKVAELAGERVAASVDLARRHGVHILVGSGPVVTQDRRFVNAAQLVTPGGQVGEQEKLTMTPFERDWGVSPGRPLRVFDTELGCIGIAICYDSEFPLLVRAQVEAGAELVLVPSCTERLSGAHRVRAAARARALESQIATVVSPAVGDALWSPAVDRNVGMAGIYVPPEPSISDTGVLAEGTLDVPGWTTAAIDLAGLRLVRDSGEMRNHADWPLQPGAAPLGHVAEVVSLR